jgi:hypothetical protein
LGMSSHRAAHRRDSVALVAYPAPWQRLMSKEVNTAKP